MAFRVILYTNLSPMNKVDKSITEVGYGTGAFRQATSICEPVLTFQTLLTAQTLKEVNYAYIEELERYYFVTDITSVVTELWELSMHVDVLMTYKDHIRRQMAVVARQERLYNMMLDDGWFMAYQNPIIQTKYFSTTSPFGTDSYVLTLAGS